MKTPILMCIRKVGDEFVYSRWVGRIRTHEFGYSGPLTPTWAEEIRLDPDQFESEKEAPVQTDPAAA